MVLENVQRTSHAGITRKWCGATPLMWVAQSRTAPFFLRPPRVLLSPVERSWFATMAQLGTIEVNFPTQTTRKGNSYLCNRHEEQEDLCRMVMALDYTFQYNYIHSFIHNKFINFHSQSAAFPHCCFARSRIDSIVRDPLVLLFYCEFFEISKTNHGA